MADLHVVSYEVERDLLPLILANCQYRVAAGGESLQELDLARIQRQLAGRLLQGKPRLRLRGLPTLVLRRDWDFEQLCAAVRGRVPQVSRPRPPPAPRSSARPARGPCAACGCGQVCMCAGEGRTCAYVC